MGAWGEYDDQQDSVMDEWEEVLTKIVPSTKVQSLLTLHPWKKSANASPKTQRRFITL